MHFDVTSLATGRIILTAVSTQHLFDPAITWSSREKNLPISDLSESDVADFNHVRPASSELTSIGQHDSMARMHKQTAAVPAAE